MYENRAYWPFYCFIFAFAERIDGLETQLVCLIASGKTHSVAVNDAGHIFTWGDNQFSQLGRQTPTELMSPAPKWVGFRAITDDSGHHRMNWIYSPLRALLLELWLLSGVWWTLWQLVCLKFCLLVVELWRWNLLYSFQISDMIWAQQINLGSIHTKSSELLET